MEPLLGEKSMIHWLMALILKFMDVLRHWCIGLHSLFHMQLTHWSIDVVLHSHVLIVLQPLLHEFKVWVAYFPEFRSHWCIDALVHWFAPSVYGSIVPWFNCRIVASNPCLINPQHHRFNWMMFQRFSVHSCNCFMRPWGMLVACSCCTYALMREPWAD